MYNVVAIIHFWFFFRPDQKARVSRHIKGRKDALASSNALCVNANG